MNISSTPTTRPWGRGTRGRNAAFDHCRPGVAQVMAYRRHVTEAMMDLLDNEDATTAALVELGLHHEQQHQELIMMDAKHAAVLQPAASGLRQGGTARGVAPIARRMARAQGAGWSRSAADGAGFAAMPTTKVLVTRHGSSRSPSHRDQVSSWRVSRLHRGRRRLSPSRVLVVGRMGVRDRPRLGGTALLGEEGRAVARLHPVRIGTDARRRSGVPRQRLRSRHRLRQMGGQAFAARGRVGETRSGRSRRPPARSGNGPPAPTSPIRVIANRRAQSASTTASSWPTSWCCGVVALPRRPTISARPIATSFRRMPVGCLAAFAWQRIFDERSASAHTLAQPPSTELETTEREDFRRAVLAGLSRRPRAIPAKFLYDAKGSALFDEICELPEYYLTRTETKILRDRARDIAHLAGPGAALVEFGSGSSVKSRLLLDAMADLAVYAPIDISREHLEGSAARLRRDYPHLRVEPVFGDYAGAARVAAGRCRTPPAGILSRIDHRQSRAAGGRGLPAQRANLAGHRWRAGAGRRPTARTSAGPCTTAYNDAAGVTAAVPRSISCAA